MWLLLALMILHPNTIKPIIPVGNSTASLLYLGPAVLALIGIAMCFNTFDETPLLMVLAAVILGFAASGVSWVRPAVVDPEPQVGKHAAPTAILTAAQRYRR